MNNKDEPFYRWYPFVEGFSGELVKSIIDELGYLPSQCLDPFSGSGTSPLACQEKGIKCVSFEVNPFLYDLARVKLYRYYDLQFLNRIVEELEINLDKYAESRSYPKIDTITLFESEGLDKWIFNREVAFGILDILEEIEIILGDEKGNHRLLLRIVLASILLSISNVFRNGKCLSYKQDWGKIEISRKNVHRSFLDTLRNIIIKDLLGNNTSYNAVENYQLCKKGSAES